MSVQPEHPVILPYPQLHAILEELQLALDALEELAPLCSIQTRASRAEEAICAAMYMLRSAQQAADDEP